MVPGCLILLLTVAGVLSQDGKDIRLPPSITESGPLHHYFRPDGDFTIPCIAEGTPAPTYTWTKNGLSLTVGAGTIQWTGDGGSIKISGLGTNDMGYYQCIASNEYGKALSNVTFMQKATLAPYPPNQPDVTVNLNAYEPATVICSETLSVPHASYSWSLATSQSDRNPVPIVTSARVTIDQVTGNLLFTHVEGSDAQDGKLYKCNNFNPITDTTIGGSYTEIQVDPKPAVNTAPKPFFKTLSPHVVIGEDDLRLKCAFSGFPVPAVQWQKRGDSLPTRRYRFEEYGTELLITNVEESDAGVYICKASNLAGTSEEVYINVEVELRPKFIPGMVPAPKNATDGDTVTFSCDAKAVPAANIQWYINGEVLDEATLGPDRVLSTDGKNLTIKNVCKECNGRSDLMSLQCNASNIHGYVFGNGYLNVLRPTVIATPPENQALEFYEPVRFHCVGNSDDSTPVAITWKRDSYLIIYEKGRIEQDETDGSLLIITENEKDGGKSFEGEYTCVASNGYSSQMATASLTVPVGPAPFIPETVTGRGILDLWWIFVIIAVILLLLILLICCCLCMSRNKGDEYLVDEKERKNGNDPEKELVDSGFQDYQRPEEAPMKGSRASLSSTIKLGDSDDEGSLNEYGDIDPGKFTEDGSFIGEYLDTGKKKRPHDSTV